MGVAMHPWLRLPPDTPMLWDRQIRESSATPLVGKTRDCRNYSIFVQPTPNTKVDVCSFETMLLAYTTLYLRSEERNPGQELIGKKKNKKFIVAVSDLAMAIHLQGMSGR
ncbi:hypothetical protein M758_6G137600 [Ceratodon purpureus]|nr:hypothetical protein M758_6G137600 [Ceratodon purpureus]